MYFSVVFVTVINLLTSAFII